MERRPVAPGLCPAAAGFRIRSIPGRTWTMVVHGIRGVACSFKGTHIHGDSFFGVHFVFYGVLRVPVVATGLQSDDPEKNLRRA